MSVLNFSLLRIFQGYLVICCLIINVLCFCCLATAILDYHISFRLSTTFFISFLLSVLAAIFIYYHICYCLSTTFLTHFFELSYRFSRWTFNISLLYQLVKGICSIFLYNFQLYFRTTKCAYFFCIFLYFVVNKKIAAYRCFHPLPAICFNYIY